MANSRPLQFLSLETGCFIPLTHRLNADGYFRKRWTAAGKNVLEMFHRFIWRAHKGDIPEGFEINHLCGCRSCCNIKHLECIEGSQHAILSNVERYQDSIAMFKKLIEENKTVQEMIEITGLTKEQVYSRRYRYKK